MHNLEQGVLNAVSLSLNLASHSFIKESRSMQASEAESWTERKKDNQF